MGQLQQYIQAKCQNDQRIIFKRFRINICENNNTWIGSTMLAHGKTLVLVNWILQASPEQVFHFSKM